LTAPLLTTTGHICSTRSMVYWSIEYKSEYSHVLKEKQGLKRVRLNFWEEFREELEYG